MKKCYGTVIDSSSVDVENTSIYNKCNTSSKCTRDGGMHDIL